MSIINVATILVQPSFSEENYPLHVEHTDFHENKELLLLLHGYLGSIDDYYPYFIELMDDYDIIAIDLRGHGKSLTPSNPAKWTISCLSEDIKHVMDILNVANKPFTIIASSLSTAIALEFTNNYPSRVNKLFLISPSSDHNLPIWSKIILGIEKLTPKILSKAMINLFSGIVLTFNTNKEKKEILKDGQDRFNKIEYEVHQKIMHETMKSWEIEIQNVVHPTLIVAGENDTTVPYNDSIKLNEELTHSSLITLRNTGHRILLDRPNIIFQLLRVWLEDYADLLENPFHNEENLFTTEDSSHTAFV